MLLKKVYVHRMQFPLILAFICDSTQMSGSVVGLCHHGPVGAGVLSRYGICGSVMCETAGEPAFDSISQRGNQGEFQNQPFETGIPAPSASVHCPSTVYNTEEKAQACWLPVNNNNRDTQRQAE